MLDNRYDLTSVLAAYPANCQPKGPVTPIFTGGFSGSMIWRLESDRGPLCLRRWPQEHPSSAALRRIHGVLFNVAQAGFTLIPLPIATRDNQSFLSHDEHLWELTPWLAGEPDISQPPGVVTSPVRIDAALIALAQFHRALAANPASHSKLSQNCPAIGLQKRLGRLAVLQAGGLDRLLAAIAQNRAVWPELALRSTSLLQLFNQSAEQVEKQMQLALRHKVPSRMCIRDIHRQHVLFNDDRVTGIIDFGAMNVDDVACDVARLLGSMAQDDRAAWQTGLSAFCRVHPLCDEEIQLVKVYDESSVLLSGINWLQWVFEDGRLFHDSRAVLARFDQIAERLRQLANRIGSIVV